MKARLIALLSSTSLLVAAACGAGQTEQTTSSRASSTTSTARPDNTEPVTTQAAAPVTTGSTLLAVDVGSQPSCEPGTTPALASYALATSEVAWSFCSADEAWREVLGVTNDVVYLDAIPHDQGTQELMAIDAETGSELWKVAHSYPLGWPLGPFTGGGVIVISSQDDDGEAIVAIDAGTGTELWRSAAVTFGPIANTEDVVVLAGSLGLGGLRGLERSTGRQLWTSDVHFSDESGVVVSRGATAVTGDTVIVPTGQTLTAIDARTGAELWQAPRLDHPAAFGQYVVGYVPDEGPVQSLKVTVLNAATGETLWTQQGTPSYGELWAVDDEAIFVLDGADGSGIVRVPSSGPVKCAGGAPQTGRSAGPNNPPATRSSCVPVESLRCCPRSTERRGGRRIPHRPLSVE